MEQNELKFLKPGTLLNKQYEIVRHIASGGFGNTYLARNRFGCNVAIKEFYLSGVCTRKADSSNVTVSIGENKKIYDAQKLKFQREAQRIHQLSGHPNIVKVFDLFEENDTAYYVMDYIKGSSLAQVDKPIAEPLVMHYLNQILSALEYVHLQGILHLDIKPNNIMIDNHGNAILIDFGASKQYDLDSANQSMLSTTGLAYTPGYAPLEQTGNQKKKVGPHSDIYSLGATLYNLLTGQTPPSADEILEDGIPHIENLSPKFRKIIEAAMTVVAKNRPGSVGALRTLLNTSSTTIVEKKEVKTQVQPKRNNDVKHQEGNKNKWIVWTCVVVALIAIAVGAYAVIGDLKPKGTQDEPIVNIDEEQDKTPIDQDDDQHQDDEKEVDVETDAAYFYDAVGDVSFKMIRVEGGSFTMGATSEQAGAQDDEYPTHKVTLSDYYIAETEVSQALWRAVMGSNPSHFKGDNRPVETVSWEKASEFCRKLSNLTGRTYCLPTEAQWEFAARGGVHDVKSKYAGSDNINQVACYYNNSEQSTRNVGEGMPNELGLYNMSGNVTEWCSDWYSPRYSSEEQYNPTGPSGGTCHVGRGGQWGSPATSCRVSNRDNFKGQPNYAQFNCGLRIVCQP